TCSPACGRRSARSLPSRAGQGRAKTDYLAYEEIASVIRERPLCRERARLVLNAITRATLGTHEGCAGLVKDEEMSTAVTTVLRIAP
ncbi:MAG: hypothetical protein ACO1OB_33715, partial [Archangium sp.]